MPTHDETLAALCRALRVDRRELVDRELARYLSAARALVRVGATERQLEERAEWWREHWAHLALTPRGLVSMWATLGGHVAHERERQQQRVRSTAEPLPDVSREERAKVAAMMREQTARMGRIEP